ncbi:hypothetical protein YC2023_075536 [Brassica napus]
MAFPIFLSPYHIHSCLKHIFYKEKLHLLPCQVSHYSQQVFPPHCVYISKNTLHQNLPNLSRVNTIKE